MNLVISAYACAPNRGSDHAVGWAWITEACRLGHEVWAVVSSVHRASIEAACAKDPALAGIRWLYPEVCAYALIPEIEPRWERTYNFLWQRAAIAHVRKVVERERVDLIHHLTWAGIRAPTYLGGLGPPLILGPVGGGESSPRGLRDTLGMRGRLLEFIRDVSTATILWNPLVRPGLKHAAAIFVSTADTQRVFSGRWRRKTTVYSQLGLPELPAVAPRPAAHRPIRLIFAGRLLYWKGVHIALQAFARIMKYDPDARLSIVGDGPERERLVAEAARLGARAQVDFIARLPQDVLFRMYREHSLLLFPSLHDSGGFVVLEAMSFGLPVVCLDLGGPRDLVTPEAGLVIPTVGRSTAEVADAIANAVCGLIRDPERLAGLSVGARARADAFVMRKRVGAFYSTAAEMVRAEPEASSLQTGASVSRAVTVRP